MSEITANGRSWEKRPTGSVLAHAPRGWLGGARGSPDLCRHPARRRAVAGARRRHHHSCDPQLGTEPFRRRTGRDADAIDNCPADIATRKLATGDDPFDAERASPQPSLVDTCTRRDTHPTAAVTCLHRARAGGADARPRHARRHRRVLVACVVAPCPAGRSVLRRRLSGRSFADCRAEPAQRRCDRAVAFPWPPVRSAEQRCH